MIVECKSCDSIYNSSTVSEQQLCKFCGLKLSLPNNLDKAENFLFEDKYKKYCSPYFKLFLLLIMGLSIYVSFIKDIIIFVLFAPPMYMLIFFNWNLIIKKFGQRNNKAFQLRKQQYQNRLISKFPGIRPDKNKVFLQSNLFVQSTFVGFFDYDEETNSYVTFHAITLLFIIPLIPLGAYRVTDPVEGVKYDQWYLGGRSIGPGWIILGKVPYLRYLTMENVIHSMKPYLKINGALAVLIIVFNLFK